MEEKTEILLEHKGELVYIEFLDGKLPAEITGIIGDELRNSYVKLWYVKEGRLTPTFIPIFGISLIANHDYVWGHNKDKIYFKVLEDDFSKTLKI